MHRLKAHLIEGALLCAFATGPAFPAATELASLAIDYPANGSIFPPEMTAPRFAWHDSSDAEWWGIEVRFRDLATAVGIRSAGEAPRIGDIDPRCISETNEVPKLGPKERGAHTWLPDRATWDAFKRHATEAPADVVITGYTGYSGRAISRGRVAVQISRDPVGAPIFYRDVPLMPSEVQKGVIKPLAPSAALLVNWRLRNVGEDQSRLLLEGIHTCANCHSFSRDGRTLGIDLDGPQNDKGLYAIAPVSPQMTIRNEDVIAWDPFRPKTEEGARIGFLSQVSPDGRFIVSTVNVEYYVANFKDYRFLQVFYPTRGILACYDRTTRRIQSLPGANDPRYVQANAVWSPDGKYIVFARATARDPYPKGRRLAEYAKDPNELPIQFDLFRIPFNDGRGGTAEPIAGASHNGMSNSFPKVSPDGRWIVYVQARNGLLMRPDGQLYIVPAAGGRARRMRCNTELMNSWHSFSPNGRWMVFSSKSRSPYTQMFLTHIDEGGTDSPAVLIENATAANRAVNLPEFVNIPSEGLLRIDVPAVEFYRVFDQAVALARDGKYEAAVEEWGKALQINPEDAKAHNNLADTLVKVGKLNEAIAHYERALRTNPEYADALMNLGAAFAAAGKWTEAIPRYRRVLQIRPDYPGAHSNLGVALAATGNPDAAIAQFEAALRQDPGYAAVRYNLGLAFMQRGRYGEAVSEWRIALTSDPALAEARFSLGDALYARGKIAEAVSEWRQGLRTRPDSPVVLNKTARVRATSPDASIRSGAEAVDLAERATRLTEGRDLGILDTLAAAYAESGRFAEALQTARRALALAMESDSSLAGSLKTRIPLYETGKPLREQPPRPSAP